MPSGLRRILENCHCCQLTLSFSEINEQLEKLAEVPNLAKGNTAGECTSPQTVITNQRLATMHSNIGLALYDQGKYAGAKLQFTRAIGAKEKDARVQNNLGAAWQALGNTSEAKQCYMRALKIQPDYLHANKICHLSFVAGRAKRYLTGQAWKKPFPVRSLS